MAKVLVVEDSPDVRALIQMLLEAGGHETVAVTDGRAAIAAARDAAPDLILMDLSLPIVSGWEATRQIRADPKASAIPIVAVTAHAMQGDRERALAAGCDGFIPKPIDEATFAARVTAFLGVRPGPSRPAPGRVTLPGGGPGRILVVDDQPEVADLLKIDLEVDGHDVVVATSSAEAIAAFGSDGRVDLCVIDVMLGGGDSGYALTRQLTEGSPEYCPVLLVTAGTIDREKGFRVGADDFIGKPIETVELRARARSLIRVGRLIREQRRVGRERSEAYRKLSELDRMQSDFLSTVSHELRTPLNTIVLLAHQLLKADGAPADPPRRTRDTRVLLDAAETLRRMIDNMLDLAKLEAGQRDLHPQPVSVAELLRENAALLEPQARQKQLELVVQPDPALPGTSYLDREKLSRVLVNLLSNAVKYTTSGRVTLSATPWQGSTTFEVRDTGYGIPAELIGSAFEPFRQIRPRTGDAPHGTGLGLTISKQLVAIMGGDLILESKEGEGTSVRFTLPDLPATADGPRDSAETRVRRPRPRPDKSLIFIVEDDQASRYGLASLLESEGYQVAEGSNLKEADALLQSRRPAAIVLDITLPDGDGAVWLRSWIDRDPAFPPVLALTGVTADEDTRRIEASGVSRVLTKPVN
ncbi:MAG TPA: response regulator, partial [Thermoanaerobaculia bacterium]